MLEAVGVFQLAKTGMAAAALDGERAGVGEDETAFFDLDSNVMHYGDGGGADVPAAKFPTDGTIGDDDLADDLEGAAADVVAELPRRVTERGVRLYELDLTTPDVADLGLVRSGCGRRTSSPWPSRAPHPSPTDASSPTEGRST